MGTSETLLGVVERACKRARAQVTLREATLALTIALLGPLALAALGTELLPAGLLVVFLLVGLGLGAYRWWRQQPSPYGVAQTIDSAWQAEDQISTAYYFASHPAEAGALTPYQNEKAAPLALAGDLTRALPFELSRSTYALGAVVLVLAALLGLRYGTQSNLSLKPPLAPFALPSLFAAPEGDELRRDELARVEGKRDEPAQSLRKDSRLEQPPEPLESEPVPIPADGAPGGDAVPGAEAALPEVEGLSVDSEFGDELATGSGEGEDGEGQAEAKDASGSTGEPSTDQGKPQDGAPSEESNDLLSRLQDAFKNMLSSMKMDPPSGSQSGEPSDQESGQSSPAEGAQTGQEAGGEASQAGENAGESEGSGAAPEAPQELTQGEAGSESSGAPPEGSMSSSAGSNDGSKSLSESAQLEAMGELSELYQKRAEDMSGEVLIETQAAPQQLQTPYTPTAAGHRDLGGQVSRDEIPFAYRQYVQKYFEALRQKSGN
ncbi:MAG TPA: hypothetical protein VML01_09210 [Bryobacterales bacterium]|nr:hypothetical protein [Bryobacterales bacterium]